MSCATNRGCVSRTPQSRLLVLGSNTSARRGTTCPVSTTRCRTLAGSRGSGWPGPCGCTPPSCRARCTCRTYCCGTDFKPTNRTEDAATHGDPSASLTSFSFDFLYRTTNCGLISRTTCPWRASSCPQGSHCCTSPSLPCSRSAVTPGKTASPSPFQYESEPEKWRSSSFPR